MKVKISKRALIQRINRALVKENEMLRKARGIQMFLDVGDYFTINIKRNYITRSNIDPENLGRELEVLKPYEEVI